MIILSILEDIASTSSKLAKEAILARERDNDLLQRVMVAAYNPRITYGIKQIPAYMPTQTKVDSLSWAINELQYLADRTYTGNMASDHVKFILESLTTDDATVIERILLRDLRMGCSESTINKVWSNLIPEYPYMRYNLFSKIKTEKLGFAAGVYVQEKQDGSYTSIDFESTGNMLGLTRQGAERPAGYFADIYNHISANFDPAMQYHGEVLVEVNGAYMPREEGNGIINSISKGGTLEPGQKLVYVVWDMVALDVIQGAAASKVEYETRFNRLSSFKFGDTVRLVPTEIVHSIADAFVIYAKALATKKEGVMLKSKKLLWKDGTTTMGAKLKLEVDVDLVITGFTEGKGARASTFGAVNCESSDGLLKVDVSGFSDKMLQYISANRDRLLGTIMTVKSNDITKTTPASLYLPRFAELREDKKVADTFQQIIDQFENAKLGK
jgi:DNA ligase-1